MPAKTTTIYSFKTKITSVKQHYEPKNWRVEIENGEKKTICDNVSSGWYITLDGSRESIYLGNDKPDITEGQEVKVSIIPEAT
jgi:hypothetical protein